LKKKSQKQRRPPEEAITTQYQKLSGTKLTGQTIDLSQFNKPKKKKSLKLLLSLVRPVLQELIRINAKNCSKPSTPRPPEFLVHLILIRLRQMLVVVVNANRSSRPIRKRK
jgi:hypothetical protein